MGEVCSVSSTTTPQPPCGVRFRNKSRSRRADLGVVLLLAVLVVLVLVAKVVDAVEDTVLPFRLVGVRLWLVAVLVFLWRGGWPREEDG